MRGYIGRLPNVVGKHEIIECNKCGKKFMVKYHGEAVDNDTYDHKCPCGNTLFTQSGKDGYSVVEVK